MRELWSCVRPTVNLSSLYMEHGTITHPTSTFHISRLIVVGSMIQTEADLHHRNAQNTKQTGHLFRIDICVLCTGIYHVRAVMNSDFHPLKQSLTIE